MKQKLKIYQVNTRLTAGEYAFLKIVAQDTGETLPEVVRRAIRELAARRGYGELAYLPVIEYKNEAAYENPS